MSAVEQAIYFLVVALIQILERRYEFPSNLIFLFSRVILELSFN